MKLCEAHLARIKTLMWRKGVQPLPPQEAARKEIATGKPDALGRVTQLLLTNVAESFPAATLNRPADACPFCEGAPEVWIEKAVHQICWEAKHGDLSSKPKLPPQPH